MKSLRFLVVAQKAALEIERQYQAALAELRTVDGAEALLDSLKTEQQVLTDTYNDNVKLLQEYYGDEYASHEDYIKNKLKLDETYAKESKEIAEQKTDAEIALEEYKAETMANISSAFTALMETDSETLFEIGKIGAASLATVNAYSAINTALAQEGIWGIANAVALGTAAFANVASILSTEYGDSESSSSTSISTSTSTDSSTTSTDNSVTTYNISAGSNVSTSELKQMLTSLTDSDAVYIKSGTAQAKKIIIEWNNE